MSGPWEKFGGAGPWTRFNPPAQGRSDALAAAVGQGAAFNLGDELTAAVRATVPEFSDWMMRRRAGVGEEEAPASPTTSKAATWKERYEEELAKTRQQMKADREAYPTLTTVGNIAGNVAGTAALLPAAATAAVPTLVGNIAKMGITGAGLGGVAGFGEGEGGLEDRLGHATSGAAFGGAAGAALPVAGVVGRAALESAPGRAVVEKVVSPALRAISGAPPRSVSAAAPDGTAGVAGQLAELANATGNVAQSGAIERLATALQRAKIDPAALERRLAQLGDEAVLADLDPQFLSAARMAHTMPGETRTVAKNVLEGRDRGAGPRLVSAFEGGDTVPSSFALRGEGQEFDKYLRAVGQRAYQQMDDAGLKQTPELMALYENPHVSAAIDRVMAAEKATRTGTNRPPASPVEIMHKVKQAIWDLGFDKETARPGPMASWYRDLGVEYMNRLKQANPALAAADRDYAAAASLPQYFDTGRAFLRKGSTENATDASSAAIADLLKGADPLQITAARAGAINAARETALEGTTAARGLARRIDESALVREKLVELLGRSKAEAVLRQAANEKTFAETSNDMLRGSKTADKLAEIVDTGNTAVRIGAGGVTGRVLEKVDDIINKFAGPNEAVRNEIGRLTLSTNPAENRRVLAAIADALLRRSRGQPYSAGGAAAVGSAAAQ